MSELSNIKTTRPLIAIYCGSRMGNHEIYRQKSHELIKHICQQGFGVVYGGASIGLMGEVANIALAEGSEVVGVIPEFMLDYEIAHADLTELHIVKTMHQRKALMAERACAFIALPGGLGTFEEILEVATWAQLNQHQKTMIIYNINGFYNALKQQLDHAVQEGFLPPQHRAKLLICDDLQQIQNALQGIHCPEQIHI